MITISCIIMAIINIIIISIIIIIMIIIIECREQINTPLLRCRPDRLTIQSRRSNVFVRMPRVVGF